MITYTDLKTFCDVEKITYQEFGAMVRMPWSTVYMVITGRLPGGKRTRRALDKWIRRNEKKILAALERAKEAAA